MATTIATTTTIPPAATKFLLPSHHHHHHHHHHQIGTPTPSLTPPPQSPDEAVAEVEAEVEQFRRQAYLRRGLSYPGRTHPRQSPTVAPQLCRRTSLDEVPRRRVESLALAAAVEVKPESTTAATTTLASTSTATAAGSRLPKTFSQLMEDLIRTHSSTASPSGQKYASDLLQGTIGHYKDTMFGGGTYFGSFT